MAVVVVVVVREAVEDRGSDVSGDGRSTSGGGTSGNYRGGGSDVSGSGRSASGGGAGDGGCV